MQYENVEIAPFMTNLELFASTPAPNYHLQ